MKLTGGLTSGPIGLRLLTIATITMVVLLFLSHKNLSQTTKPVCAVEVYGDTAHNKQAQHQLEKQCGPLVKVNTTTDTAYICLLAAVVICLVTTVVCGFIVIKNRWFDCYYKGLCDPLDDTYMVYAICSLFVLCFLLPAFILVSRTRERLCVNTPKNNCKSAKVNHKYMSLLQFCSYMFLAGAAGLILRLWFARDESFV